MTDAPAFPVVLRLPVLWGDADALGHVNNVRYFRWMESARIEYFRRLALDTTGSGTGPVLATTTCDYLRPVHFPADVDVGVRVTKLGGSSVAMEYGISLSSGELVARGSSVVVIVSYATMTKVTVADDVRAAIARLEGW